MSPTLFETVSKSGETQLLEEKLLWKSASDEAILPDENVHSFVDGRTDGLE